MQQVAETRKTGSSLKDLETKLPAGSGWRKAIGTMVSLRTVLVSLVSNGSIFLVGWTGKVLAPLLNCSMKVK